MVTPPRIVREAELVDDFTRNPAFCLYGEFDCLCRGSWTSHVRIDYKRPEGYGGQDTSCRVQDARRLQAVDRHRDHPPLRVDDQGRRPELPQRDGEGEHRPHQHE